MKIEGTCKISTALGMEYQFGIFYIERDYLVFEHGLSSRRTYPLQKLCHIEMSLKKRRSNLTFSCGNVHFEIDGPYEAIKSLADGLNGDFSAYQFEPEQDAQRKRKFSAHHDHLFAK
ncbi:hypothetical protein [Listeria costaricensis]|uniref:hypothetical protein n=1 Tax=Listeria costaricensis TaxID=2026604 RepID=UPI000C08060D|nr:hypothetical protein [Listeria costaricensis]